MGRASGARLKVDLRGTQKSRPFMALPLTLALGRAVFPPLQIGPWSPAVDSRHSPPCLPLLPSWGLEFRMCPESPKARKVTDRGCCLPTNLHRTIKAF